MGGLREVCGAVTGMFMIAGLLYGYSDPLDSDSKREHYELIQKLATSFKDKYDSIICRELLGLDMENENPKPQERNEKYYKSRPCGEFVGYAAKIMDEHIQNKKMEESNDKNCGSQ